jgi:fructose-1,6-bisphosphatase/inositol monophosphatase family enzyme
MTLGEFLDPLRRLHDWMRDLLIAACERYQPSELSAVVHDGAGDVTFMVDQVSEAAFIEWLTREIAVHEPIVLVGEGLPEGCITLPSTAAAEEARWRIIVDPIDGTRGLMYQKRPGWILTGVAPNHGSATSLADIALAVQTEIPLIKQHLTDQLWTFRGQGAHGIRYNRLTKESVPLAIQPSSAGGLRNGFATVCRFFPGGRDVLGALDDELCARLLGPVRPGEAAVSNDQYASTGGQLYGLMMGQDRLIVDLRPLVAPIIRARGEAPGHFCHPYGLCTKLIAEEAGVVVTDANGSSVNAPLDTEADVSWIGYANRSLQQEIEPVLGELMRVHGLLAAKDDLLSSTVHWLEREHGVGGRRRFEGFP